jgi:hypothetical protein
MEARNQFIENDGLFWESETHEWFHDKTSTQYAHSQGIHNDALPHIRCYVTRSKTTGEYDRVMMDAGTNEIIYDTKVLEEMGGAIDKLKIAKRFNL